MPCRRRPNGSRGKREEGSGKRGDRGVRDRGTTERPCPLPCFFSAMKKCDPSLEWWLGGVFSDARLKREDTRKAGTDAGLPPSTLDPLPPSSPFPLPSSPELRGKAPQRAADVAFTQALERAVAKLSDSLARDAEHGADLFERVLAAAFEPEVQAEDFGVAWRQRAQGLLDLVGEEAVHRLFLGIRHLVGHEALDERAIALGIHRCVEADVRGVERSERLNDVDREAGELRQLLGARLAVELLPENLGRLDDSRKIGGAVEWNADGPSLTGECGQDGLANPPDGVRDELDALIRIELSGGGEEADVAFTDQVDEREASVLIFLGDGDDEAQVTLDELLEGVLVAGADLFREIDLLRPFEQGIGGHLVEVLIEDIALRFVRSDPSGGRAAATTLEFGHLAVVGLSRVERVEDRASISGGMPLRAH